MDSTSLEHLCEELASCINDFPTDKAAWRALLLGSAQDVEAAVPVLEKLLPCACERRPPPRNAPILDVLHASCAVLQGGSAEEQLSDTFDYVISLEWLDGLSVKDLSKACSATLATLQPGGLAMFVSEEPEAFGSLKRCMRSLRPGFDERLRVASASAAAGSEQRIHVYRKSSSAGPEADVSQAAPVAPPSSGRPYPPGWGQWQKGWVEPARPNLNIAKMLRGGSVEVKSQVEPQEWISDALELVLLPSKGRGLVVSRPVKAGDLLLVSKALFLAPADQIQQLALSWLLEASPREKEQFYSLYDGSNGHRLPSLDLYRPVAGGQEGPGVVSPPERMDPERIYQILALNGFQADKFHAASATDPGKAKDELLSKENENGTAVSGLWTVPSLMNHACIPSTTAVPLTKATLAFLAAYDLPAGAEVTLRYCKLQMPVELRRSELKRQKGFYCSCARCVLEAEKVPQELQRRLSHVQETAASLDLAPEDFLSAIEEVTAVTRRELSARLGVEQQLQLQVLLSSYAPLFVCRAMLLEHLQCSAQRRFDAWKEVCDLLQQLEPSSPNHLYAASCCARAATNAGGAVGAVALAAWLGRHGVLQVNDQKNWSVFTLASGEMRLSALKAFEVVEPELAAEEELRSIEGWQQALALLRSHGSWASREAAAAAGKVTSSHEGSKPEPGQYQCDLPGYRWVPTSEGCQLQLLGFDAHASLDVSSEQLRVTPSTAAMQRGCRFLELDLAQELAPWSGDGSVKFVKARAARDAATDLPLLRVDFRIGKQRQMPLGQPAY